jgi:hypothetical protein
VSPERQNELRVIREKAIVLVLGWLDMHGAKVSRVIRNRGEDLPGDYWHKMSWKDKETVVICASHYPDPYASRGVTRLLDHLNCGLSLDCGIDAESRFYTVFVKWNLL